jgi:hypothetical protein
VYQRKKAPHEVHVVHEELKTVNPESEELRSFSSTYIRAYVLPFSGRQTII